MTGRLRRDADRPRSTVERPSRPVSRGALERIDAAVVEGGYTDTDDAGAAGSMASGDTIVPAIALAATTSGLAR